MNVDSESNKNEIFQIRGGMLKLRNYLNKEVKIKVLNFQNLSFLETHKHD